MTGSTHKIGGLTLGLGLITLVSYIPISPLPLVFFSI